MKPATKVYKSDVKHWISQVIGIGFFLFGVFVLITLFSKPEWFSPWWIVMFAALPPAYHFFEYRWWFDNWDDDDAVEQLEHFQDLSGKIWAGVLAVMLFSMNP